MGIASSAGLLFVRLHSVFASSIGAIPTRAGHKLRLNAAEAAGLCVQYALLGSSPLHAESMCGILSPPRH